MQMAVALGFCFTPQNAPEISKDKMFDRQQSRIEVASADPNHVAAA
jgi:hypothetical protein